MPHETAPGEDAEAAALLRGVSHPSRVDTAAELGDGACCVHELVEC